MNTHTSVTQQPQCDVPPSTTGMEDTHSRTLSHHAPLRAHVVFRAFCGYKPLSQPPLVHADRCITVHLAAATPKVALLQPVLRVGELPAPPQPPDTLASPLEDISDPLSHQHPWCPEGSSCIPVCRLGTASACLSQQSTRAISHAIPQYALQGSPVACGVAFTSLAKIFKLNTTSNLDIWCWSN